jgi:hypothetical protein
MAQGGRMSRSRRKHSIHGWGGDGSEKVSKQIWHRRLRAMMRVRLHSCDPDTVWLVDDREASDVWAMLKEAKVLFDPREHPEWMRK